MLEEGRYGEYVETSSISPGVLLHYGSDIPLYDNWHVCRHYPAPHVFSVNVGYDSQYHICEGN